MIRTTEVQEWRSVANPTKFIRDRDSLAINEILVPTDLTVENREAMAYAVSLARRWNAHLILLHVYQEPYNLDYMRGPYAFEATQRQREYTQNALWLLGEQLRVQYANCSTEFRQGTVCGEIAKAVKDLGVDLMILGVHGNRWFRRIAYGSDADAIVRLAVCPALVVRSRDGQANVTTTFRYPASGVNRSMPARSSRPVLG
jgi:nucleotide-binding universal stress UspA family protein